MFCSVEAGIGCGVGDLAVETRELDFWRCLVVSSSKDSLNLVGRLTPLIETGVTGVSVLVVAIRSLMAGAMLQPLSTSTSLLVRSRQNSSVPVGEVADV